MVIRTHKVKRKFFENRYGQHRQGNEYVIRNLYLSEEFRDCIFEPDIEALNSKLMTLCGRQKTKLRAAMADMASAVVRIEYEYPRMIKKIGGEMLEAVLDACCRYYEDASLMCTDDESSRLINLNEKLGMLEKTLLDDCEQLNREIQHKQSIGDQFLEDYEIDYELCYLSRNHGDKVIAGATTTCLGTIQEPFDEWRRYKEEHSAYDWNDKRGTLQSEGAVYSHQHCWLFHDLEDHTRLPKSITACIDRARIEIEVTYQRRFKV